VSEQLAIPGTEPEQSKVMLRNKKTGDQHRFLDADHISTEGLEPGEYELWRFGGTSVIEVIPEKTRMKFHSVVKRATSGKPRAPRKKKEATK
jgi:hypothetical protein